MPSTRTVKSGAPSSHRFSPPVMATVERPLSGYRDGPVVAG